MYTTQFVWVNFRRNRILGSRMNGTVNRWGRSQDECLQNERTGLKSGPDRY